MRKPVLVLNKLPVTAILPGFYLGLGAGILVNHQLGPLPGLLAGVACIPATVLPMRLVTSRAHHGEIQKSSARSRRLRAVIGLTLVLGPIPWLILWTTPLLSGRLILGTSVVIIFAIATLCTRGGSKRRPS